MLYFLQNEQYKVGIESKGAELRHFIKLDEELEVIWQGDPDIWAGQAPNLFPIVGELPEQQYTYNNQTYHMKRHGFARNKEFKVVEETRDKLVFQLKHDEETLQQYPFEFRLLIAYKLEGNRLSCTYQVTNAGTQTLYFSVGAHPGFNVPLYPNEQYTDYYLEFEEQETLNRHFIGKTGLQTGDTERILTESRELPLRHDYFDEDAIVLKDMNSQKLTLASKTGPRRIGLEFEGFPYFGIWAKPGPSPYVCLEPWCGIASREGEAGRLEDKEGIQKLSPKQVFERTLVISVF